MPFTAWSGRLTAAGATPAESVSISVAYANSPGNVQAALDTLIGSIAAADLLVMLTTWRSNGGPFGNGFPLGGLPFGARAAMLSGSGADDAFAVSFGTGQRVSAGNFPRVFFGGHSLVAGFQNVEGGERFATRVAAALHAEEVTYAQTSAVLARDDSSGNAGGFASILNGLRPRAWSPSAMSDRAAAPYLSLSPVVVFDFGFNDLIYMGASTATNVAWFSMALRAITCVARLGGIFSDTRASVSYGGVGASHWTANSNTTSYGSPTDHSTSTLGDTVTITVPADFPGGEVDIFTLAYGGGAQWSTVVDGGAAQVLNGLGSAFGSGAYRSNLVVQRLTGLSAGTHTIVMTLAALDPGATAYFDCWGIAASEIPLVIYCTQPAGAPCLPLATATAHTPVTVADVAALNAALLAVQKGFDQMVRIADVDAYFAQAAGNVPSTSPGSLFFADNLHPNTRGHGVAAQCVLDAIASAVIPAQSPLRVTALSSVQRNILGNGWAGAWPNGGEPGLTANWSPVSTSIFKRTRDARVELNISVSRTGTPALAETILTLPPGYAPALEVLLPCLSWNAAYTVATPGLCAVRPTGAVVWYSGSPTTDLEITGSWLADGLGY